MGERSTADDGLANPGGDRIRYSFYRRVEILFRYVAKTKNSTYETVHHHRFFTWHLFAFVNYSCGNLGHNAKVKYDRCGIG
jgi:hypothetical protein